MKIKGIIFDFGFTLFSFENPSVEKYFDCFKRGLLKSIDLLKVKRILDEEDEIVKDFIDIFNKKRAKSFRLAMKTKDEFPTTLLFKTVLAILKEKGYNINYDNIEEEFLEEMAEIYHSCEESEWKPFNETKATLEALSNVSNLKVSFSSTVCSSSILQLSQNFVSTRRYFPQERHLNHNLRPQFLQNSPYLLVGALQRGQIFFSNQK